MGRDAGVAATVAATAIEPFSRVLLER